MSECAGGASPDQAPVSPGGPFSRTTEALGGSRTAGVPGTQYFIYHFVSFDSSTLYPINATLCLRPAQSCHFRVSLLVDLDPSGGPNFQISLIAPASCTYTSFFHHGLSIRTQGVDPVQVERTYLGARGRTAPRRPPASRARSALPGPTGPFSSSAALAALAASAAKASEGGDDEGRSYHQQHQRQRG